LSKPCPFFKGSEKKYSPSTSSGRTEVGQLRIVFMGSPVFALATLVSLVAAGHEVVAVYCQPPRPAGRGKADRKTPVQGIAESLGLEVRHPASLKSADEQAAFAALNADVAVVAAYGLILPQAILDAPKFGCLNVHASLLPRWRGAAPIQRAILAGDEVTGITIMQMEAGLDTGPMLLQGTIPINGRNFPQLADELTQLGATLMTKVLEDIPSFKPVEQTDDGVTYAAKIDKSEARIDWTRSAAEIDREVRAFVPTPGSWFSVGDERIRLLMADLVDGSGEPGEVLDDQLTIACGEGAIRAWRLQRAGRPALEAPPFLRGFPIPKGTILK
jgi:methionyl-tRNA formyltransferase